MSVLGGIVANHSQDRSWFLAIAVSANPCALSIIFDQYPADIPIHFFEKLSIFRMQLRVDTEENQT